MTSLTPLVFVMPKSAMGAISAVDAVAVLLSGTGSGGVSEVSVAVLTIGSGVTYPAGTATVAVIVKLLPAVTVPKAHGKPAAQGAVMLL